MFVTKRAMSRRSLLRGAGTALALPFLDAMVPAFAAPTAGPTPRLGFIYIANGVIQDQWIPKRKGADYDLPPILQPLGDLRKSINVISGLSHLQADTFGDGTGDHPRASAAWLTGVHAYDRTRPDVEVKLATTADQLAARVIGKDIRLASLELSVDYPTAGSCDSGDCFYVNTVSWRNEKTPNPTESNPRIVFERLFGDGGSEAQRRSRAKSAGSILDSILEETSSLNAQLGSGDREKLDEYLDSIRETELRIRSAESQQEVAIELPDRPTETPESFEAHVKLMLDLQALAFRADLTRVFSMIFSRELSPRTFVNLGFPEQHHALSHHRNDPEMIVKKAKIDVYHMELFAYFLKKLEATREGDGTLLDHSMILYGGGMGNGNLHRHNDLPTLMAGKLGGKFKTGYHHAFPMDTPMTNLLLTILDKAGAPIQKLGDSTEPLSIA